MSEGVVGSFGLDGPFPIPARQCDSGPDVSPEAQVTAQEPRGASFTTGVDRGTEH